MLGVVGQMGGEGRPLVRGERVGQPDAGQGGVRLQLAEHLLGRLLVSAERDVLPVHRPVPVPGLDP